MVSLKNELLMQKVKEKVASIYHCKSTDFDKQENVFVEKTISDLSASSVGNYGQDVYAKIVTFGSNVVVYGDKKILNWCKDNFANEPAQEVLDFPMSFKLEQMLNKIGKTIDSVNTRYLKLAEPVNLNTNNSFSLEWFEKGNFENFYNDGRIKHAFSPQSGKDVLAVAAFEGDKLASIAACDSVWGYMWQIGIDTMPEYRGNGLATYLTVSLSEEIENRGFIPFYSTWPANLASAKVALASGFRPVWCEFHIEDIK